MREAMTLDCNHAGTCSLCSWITLSESDQKNQKIQSLTAALKSVSVSLSTEITYLPTATSGLRDRVDLIYEKGHFGFYEAQNARQIFKLTACPLMSKPLAEYYEEVRQLQIPISKGSLRLRVSPQGLRGAWLDFANEDVRDLLAERTTLEKLLNLGFVEIGQRRKHLNPETFKLRDPEYRTWTRSWSKARPIELQSLIGSFSQSGDLANQILIREMETLFRRAEAPSWVEFGAGSGNLTVSLAGVADSVLALETDRLAFNGFRKTLSQHPELAERIELREGDFQRRDQHSFRRDQAVLVNPPRSGLMKFLDPLFELNPKERPAHFVYMSCHPTSFTGDAARLQQLGYRIRDLKIVDQFPHSPHFEILSRFELS
jgi:23S rRNA (uracil1939-C5)-methyltransferase